MLGCAACRASQDDPQRCVQVRRAAVSARRASVGVHVFVLRAERPRLVGPQSNVRRHAPRRRGRARTSIGAGPRAPGLCAAAPARARLVSTSRSPARTASMPRSRRNARQSRRHARVRRQLGAERAWAAFANAYFAGMPAVWRSSGSRLADLLWRFMVRRCIPSAVSKPHYVRTQFSSNSAPDKHFPSGPDCRMT